jgi:hypothetical protein
MHTTCTIFVLFCITAIINQAYLHPRHHKAPTDWQTIGTRCQQDKPRIRKNSPKGHTKAQQSFKSYYSLFVSHFDTIALVNKLWHSTLTTQKFFSILIVVNKRWKKPPPTRNNKNPSMLTRQQTERARLQSEKKTAEAAFKLQMEKGQLKRLEEKKQRDAERKQEEELRKNAEAEQRKLQVSTIAEATVVSPPTQMEEDRADPSINSHLLDMMQGGSEEDTAEDEGEQRSLVKSKQKNHLRRSNGIQTCTQAHDQILKPAFKAHKHTHPRTIVDASIKLTGSSPVQDFIVNLQELLKNGQMVDKMFAFCPINPDGTDNKTHEICNS